MSLVSWVRPLVWVAFSTLSAFTRAGTETRALGERVTSKKKHKKQCPLDLPRLGAVRTLQLVVAWLRASAHTGKSCCSRNHRCVH